MHHWTLTTAVELPLFSFKVLLRMFQFQFIVHLIPVHPLSVKLKYPGKQRSHEWPVTPGLQWQWPPSCPHVVPFSVPVLLQEQAAKEQTTPLSKR